MPDPIGGVQPFAELARGGATVVYKGYQRADDRFVLLKTVRPEWGADEDLVSRFEEEARLAAQVRHPNVVSVYDSGRDGTTAYLVTEFVEGTDLGGLLARGGLPPELAAYVLDEAARGLAAAHAQGVLHRDLKPANLMVSESGTVKLTDFGLASLAPTGCSDGVLNEGEVRGTLAYLAPEIVRGDPPGRASDLFALGAVLAEMLTGRAPFARDTPGATLDAVLHHDPLPVLASDPRVPSALVELAGKLLAKDPRRRLPDAPSLIEALEPIRVRYSAEAVDLATYLRAPASYIPPPPPELSSLEWKGSTKGRQAVPSRRRVGWGVAASVVVLALLAVVGTRLASEQASSLSGGPSSAPRTAVVGDPPAERPPESPDPPSGVDAVSEAADPPPAEQLPGEGEISPETEEDAEPPGEGAAEGDGAAAVEATSDAEEPIRSPGAESAPGTLVVVAEPWAEVRVDGEVVGTTPLGMLTLPVGQHVVSFANPEFPSHEVEVEVESGEEARLAVSLWDLVGRVTVEASPWAEVFVDGVYWDTVPPQARPLILRPGSHRLVFRHPALDTHELTLRIAAGESRTLRINLNAPPATEGESLP